MRYIGILFAIALMSCAQSSQTVMPDGRPGYSINCSGTALTMGDCYQKAGEVCPSGYQVIDRSENSGWTAGAYYTGSTSTRSILVECK